jgi:hypothetical protein
MATAKRTNAIVSSLFPSNVRDRILKDAEEQAEQDMLNNKKGFWRCTEEQAQDFPRRRQCSGSAGLRYETDR